MAEKKNDEHLASDFIRIAERYYTDWPQLLLRSFTTGMVTALGATVGLGIVLWATGLTLTHLGVLPVIGDFFIRLNNFINTTTH